MKLLFMALYLALTGAIYPTAMTVTAVTNEAVTMETKTGHVFEMGGSEDYEVGDLVAVIMFSNGTETVTDDVIVAARYAG